MRKVALVMSMLALTFSVACGTTAEDQTVAPPPADYDESPAASGAKTQTNEKGTKTFTDTEFETGMELDNFYFEPTYIKAPGDSTARLELHNEGDVQHTFTIDDLDVDEELAPDESKTIEVELGTETRYEFYCRFHEPQGMRGAFQPH